jgi:hypothetical protein
MRRVNTPRRPVLFLLAFSGGGACLLKGVVNSPGWLKACLHAKAILQQEVAGFLQTKLYDLCVTSLGLAGLCMLFALLWLLTSGPLSSE